jgi:AcrR family transcriptional regulator
MGEHERDDGAERDRILAAAWDVLGRTSYENLKIQAVIRSAGVSTRAFYRHFSGKQELVAELLRAELRRATAILDELTADGTPEQRVRAWVDGVVSLAYGRAAGPRARWFTSLPHEILELLDDRPRDCRTAAPLEAAIADGLTEGVFPSADPHRDALLVEGLCSSLGRGGVDWLGHDRDEGVARVADFVLAALRNPARPALDHSSGDPHSTPSTISAVIRSSS